MNNSLLKAISDSGIQDEIIAAVESISANRSLPTPVVLIYFVGFVEPTVPLSDTDRNTALLAILSHYPLNTSGGT